MMFLFPDSSFDICINNYGKATPHLLTKTDYAIAIQPTYIGEQYFEDLSPRGKRDLWIYKDPCGLELNDHHYFQYVTVYDRTRGNKVVAWQENAPEGTKRQVYRMLEDPKKYDQEISDDDDANPYEDEELEEFIVNRSLRAHQ